MAAMEGKQPLLDVKPMDLRGPDVQGLPSLGAESEECGWLRQESAASMFREELHAVGGCTASSKGITGVLMSVCLLVQSIMGGGLLAYPHAYMTGGVVNMWILQAVLLVFIFLSLWVLAWCTERTNTETFQGMVRKSLGRRAEIFCVIVLVVLIFGASVVYLDVCVDQVAHWVKLLQQSCLEGALDPARWTCKAVSPSLLGNRAKLTAVVALTVSLLCLGRSIASLAIPSLFGFGALIFVCFVIIANYRSGKAASDAWMAAHPALAAAALEDDGDGVTWWRSGLSDWLSMVPVICFSYQGHISAVPLYAELKFRSNLRWLKVVTIGLLACVLLYNAAGLLGYMQFRSSTDSDILKSFALRPEAVHVSPDLIDMARGSIALAVSVTSAVFTFCARSAILDEVRRFCHLKPSEGDSNGLFFATTYIWVAAVTAAAILVPDMGAVVAIVGNFSAFFMFLFPGLCLLSYAREETRVDDWLSKRNMLLIGWSLTVLGTFVFVFGLANALYQFYITL